MYRTKAGLIFEKILHENKHRYLFCWNGENNGDAYDCACCITWPDDDLYCTCGCICHKRIEILAECDAVHLWLLAMEAMGELPRVFTSYADKLTYSKEQLAEHAVDRADWTPEQCKILGDCKCEDCEFARNDPKIRKFAIEGEDNSNIHGEGGYVSESMCDCNCKEKEKQVCDVCQKAKDVGK